jgi:hypothetical protein
MTTLFKKLNFKNQSQIHVVNHPTSFEGELSAISDFTEVISDQKSYESIDFLLIFVKTQEEITNYGTQFLSNCNEDSIVWFCYPKGSSKNYKCEFNRDTGWQKLGNLGYEGVRQVSIDEDWSALRFKKAEKIKTMTRDFAMSDIGKKRTGKS